MKIKIKKSVVIGGHPGVVAGEILEVDAREGGNLINEGVAELVTEDISVREPEVENRDPQSKRSRKTQP